jgi:hypothetical protein
VAVYRIVHKHIYIYIYIYICLYTYIKNRGSAVGVATGYRLEERGVGDRVSVELRMFTSPYHPDPGVHSASYPMVTGSLPRGNAAGAWSLTLTSTSA